MTDKVPVTSASAPPGVPYSPGLVVGEWVFLAGQVGAGSTIEEQASDALSKVDALLTVAGTTLDGRRILPGPSGRPGRLRALQRGVRAAFRRATPGADHGGRGPARGRTGGNNRHRPPIHPGLIAAPAKLNWVHAVITGSTYYGRRAT